MLSLQAVGLHHWLGVAGDVTGHHHPSTRPEGPRGSRLHHSATPPAIGKEGQRCSGETAREMGMGRYTRRAKRNEIGARNEVTIGRFRAHHGCPGRVALDTVL